MLRALDNSYVDDTTVKTEIAMNCTHLYSPNYEVEMTMYINSTNLNNTDQNSTDVGFQVSCRDYITTSVNLTCNNSYTISIYWISVINFNGCTMNTTDINVMCGKLNYL